MKQTSATKAKRHKRMIKDDLLPEYRFDYSKAKPNRYAARMKPGGMVVVLEPDVADYFQTAEAVNAFLRALVQNLPQPDQAK